MVDNGNANQKDYFQIIAREFTRDLNQGFEIDVLNSDFDLQRTKRHNVITSVLILKPLSVLDSPTVTLAIMMRNGKLLLEVLLEQNLSFEMEMQVHQYLLHIELLTHHNGKK